MPKYKHDGLGLRLVLKDDITQADLEKFAKALRELDRDSLIEYRGAVVRASVKAGIIDEPEVNVDETPPLTITWMSNQIDAYYSELTTIPPE
jgi:hypothetical protein